MNNEFERVDSRKQSELRPFKITAGTNPYAEGSAEVLVGSTRVIVVASVDKLSDSELAEGVGGTIVTSVSMLPRSTHVRIENQLISQALELELQSIQALLGRSLRAAISAEQISKIKLTVDCCVVCSDAGIAAAVIAGGWVASFQAMRWAALNKLVGQDLFINRVAAVTGGLVNGNWVLDLCAEEARDADFVVNFVIDEKQNVVDIRAGSEKAPIANEYFSQMLSSATEQVALIFAEQERAVLELN